MIEVAVKKYLVKIAVIGFLIVEVVRLDTEMYVYAGSK